jgi:hypothetical protein
VVLCIQRTSPELKARGSRLFELQTWVALPAVHEETGPSFAHYEEADLPVLDAEGKRVRVVVGQAWGLRWPVETFSDTIYADVRLEPSAALPRSFSFCRPKRERGGRSHRPAKRSGDRAKRVFYSGKNRGRVWRSSCRTRSSCVRSRRSYPMRATVAIGDLSRAIAR